MQSSNLLSNYAWALVLVSCNSFELSWLRRIQAIGFSLRVGWVLRRIAEFCLSRITIRNVFLEDSYAISSVGMSCIVFKLAHCFVFWAYLCGLTWTCRIIVQIVPEPVHLRPSCMIALEIVVRMGDPEGSRGLIGIQQWVRRSRRNCQIVNESVIDLSSILEEEVMAHHIESNVLLNFQTIGSMQCYSPVKAIPDRWVAHVALSKVLTLGECKRMSLQLVGLSHVKELNIANLCLD